MSETPAYPVSRTGRIETVRESTAGPFNRLVASNGETLMHSENYSSNQAVGEGREAVVRAVLESLEGREALATILRSVGTRIRDIPVQLGTFARTPVDLRQEAEGILAYEAEMILGGVNRVRHLGGWG